MTGADQVKVAVMVLPHTQPSSNKRSSLEILSPQFQEEVIIILALYFELA
jgi:hypothetical protein